MANLSSGKSTFLLKTDSNNVFQSIPTKLYTTSFTVEMKRRINCLHKHSGISILESKWRPTGNSHAITHNAMQSPRWNRQGTFDCQHNKSLQRSRSEFLLSYLKCECVGVYTFVRSTFKRFWAVNGVHTFVIMASSAAIWNRKLDHIILITKWALCLIGEEFDTKRFCSVSTFFVIFQEMALAFWWYFNQLGNYAVASV